MEAFLDDRDEDINGHRDPDLSSHGVLGGAEETLEPKVLLDPLEEQLDLPTALVQSADGQRRKRKVIRQKDKSASRFRSGGPESADLFVVASSAYTVSFTSPPNESAAYSLLACAISCWAKSA